MSNKLLELAEKEMLRAEILEICRQSIPLGADEKVLLAVLRKGNLDMTEEYLKEQLYYLQGKKLVEIQEVRNEVLGIHRMIAKITPEGMDVIEGNAEAKGLGAGG